MAGDVIAFPIRGRFVRLDEIAENVCGLFRVQRHANQWEWWHYQYFDPDEQDPTLRSDAYVVEMARELGISKLVDMVHHTEVEGADKEAKKYPKRVREAYEWWREQHPQEFEDSTHSTGITLAEMIRSTA